MYAFICCEVFYGSKDVSEAVKSWMNIRTMSIEKFEENIAILSESDGQILPSDGGKPSAAAQQKQNDEKQPSAAQAQRPRVVRATVVKAPSSGGEIGHARAAQQSQRPRVVQATVVKAPPSGAEGRSADVTVKPVQAAPQTKNENAQPQVAQTQKPRIVQASVVKTRPVEPKAADIKPAVSPQVKIEPEQPRPSLREQPMAQVAADEPVNNKPTSIHDDSLAELETKIAHVEIFLDELNDAVEQQDQSIKKLIAGIEDLTEQVQESNPKSPSHEPPQY